MKTVLLTGGRAPVTLDLARKFAAKGWRVLVAESIPTHLCKESKAVAKSYLVPSPRFAAHEFVLALQEIMVTEKVDLLLPTCEEVFTVGQGYDALSLECPVFTEPLERLLPLHSKFHFIDLARSYGLAVPQTCRIYSKAEALEGLGQALVFKPEYSRFATEIILNPKQAKDLRALDASLERAWVAQEFITGRQICSYSVVQRGRITAHSAYATEFKVGIGSTIAFQALEHPQVEAWVRQFVAQYDFTGQIAFDFIETDTGEVYAIECNPRAISGVHLFDDALVDALTNAHSELIRPAAMRDVAVWWALLFYGWQAAPSLRKWLMRLHSSRDVIFDKLDWKPFLAQFSMFAYMVALSFREQLNLVEATTFDIEWNEPLILRDDASL